MIDTVDTPLLGWALEWNKSLRVIGYVGQTRIYTSSKKEISDTNIN